MASPKIPSVKTPPPPEEDSGASLDWLVKEVDAKSVEPGGAMQILEPEKELGLRLKQLREDRDLSQEQVSLLTRAHDRDGEGLSRSVISMYERGINKPSPRELRVLCDTFQVTPNELLYGREAPFGGDQWMVINNRSPAKYYARWLSLFKDLDTDTQVAIYQLIMRIKKPSLAYLEALDENGAELILKLAADLQASTSPSIPKK